VGGISYCPPFGENGNRPAVGKTVTGGGYSRSGGRFSKGGGPGGESECHRPGKKGGRNSMRGVNVGYGVKKGGPWGGGIQTLQRGRKPILGVEKSKKKNRYCNGEYHFGDPTEGERCTRGESVGGEVWWCRKRLPKKVPSEMGPKDLRKRGTSKKASGVKGRGTGVKTQVMERGVADVTRKLGVVSTTWKPSGF